MDGVHWRLELSSRLNPKGTALAQLVPNSDLWERMLHALNNRLSPWGLFWLKGHVGVVGNKQADALANRGRLMHPGRVGWLSIMQRRQGNGWLDWDPP